MKGSKQCTLKDPEASVIGNLNLADIFSCLPGHVYVKDRNGIYVACNNSNIHQGYLASDFLGKSDEDLWKEKASSIRKNDKEVMETGKAKCFIEHAKLKDGSIATGYSYKAPLRDENGNIIGIIGNTLQITEEFNRASEETSRHREDTNKQKIGSAKK